MKWPTIPGWDRFKGEKMHSAKWNSKYVFSIPYEASFDLG